MADVSDANTTQKPQRLAAVARTVRGGFGAGLLLVAFTVVFVVILLLISALNLQRAVAADVDDSVTATVGQVRLDIQTLNDLDAQQAEHNRMLADIEEKMAAYDTTMDASLETVVRVIRVHVTQHPEVPSADTLLPVVGDHEENMLRLNDRIDLYKQKVIAGADRATVTVDMLTRYLHGIEIDFEPAMEAFYQARDKWRDADKLRKTLINSKAEFADVPKLVGAQRLGNESYRTVVEDFRTFEALVGKTLFGIVLIPNPVLVLLLAVFMGMLGSLIYLARQLVIEREDIRAHEMLYRIGLGAAVALALFFFASAGVLTLSQSTSGKVDSNMSPYLISFLGITAGFLCERVTAWMREVGERTFKLENGPQRLRWGTGLAGEFAKQNIGTDTIGAAIGASGADIAAWSGLQLPVPDRAQGLLAAYLRVHPSTLFTDIDPKAAS